MQKTPSIICLVGVFCLTLLILNNKAMKLTIPEWLDKLPDDYKEKAIKNYQYDNAEHDNSKLTLQSDALKSAFAWRKSPEGYNYWQNIYNALVISHK